MDDEFTINELDNSEFLTAKSRTRCGRCKRPESVCLCGSLPPAPYQLQRSKLILLQHPNEVNRAMNTSAIIEAFLAPGSCTVYKGKRFRNTKRFRPLHELTTTTNTYVLYPSKDAISLEEMVARGSGEHYNIVLLDGTWKQAASIYAQNTWVQQLPKVKITSSSVSEYLIRTQPTDECLCTVECAAIALSVAERDPDIREMMMKPLRRLCEYQLDNGAVVHHSKQHRLSRDEDDDALS